MSRCFPFPPPGYEKKPQSSNLDFLLKKKKEKEQKKERKEKEKKEGRERKDKDKDKDRSKEKSRERKDKKEKRRDKDKKRDKEKDKKGRRDERELEAVGSSNGKESVDFVSPEVKRADVAGGPAESRRVDSPTTLHERRANLSGPPAAKKIPTAAISASADIAEPPERVDGMVQLAAVNASEKDREKKHKSKDRPKDKEEKKREKTREKGEHKGRVGGATATATTTATTTTTSVAAERKSPLSNGPHVKRDRNGFIHGDEARPNKVPRSEAPCHLTIVNGVKPDSVQVNPEEPVDFGKLQPKVNGIVAIMAPAVRKLMPATTAAATKAPENGEAAQKLPHPREIQLLELLRLPKVEEEIEPADQEWLLRPRSPEAVVELKPSSAAEPPKVWAQAVLTEPDGIVALPYVVPF